MRLAFQDTQIEYGELDRITGVLDDLNITPLSFGILPFTNHVTNAVWDEPTIMMGSTKLIKLYLNGYLSDNAIVFYDRDRFDQEWYKIHLKTHLLNHRAQFYLYGIIKDQLVSKRMFIKPSSDLKYFAGMVLEPCDNSIAGALENERMIDADITDQTTILINTDVIENIQFEYRAFIIDNKIIDCCQYMVQGKVIPAVLNKNKRARLYRFIKKMQNIYEPHKHYVMDIAELADKSFKVIEYNCINCSGIYKNNRKKIYKTLLGLPG